MSNNSAKEYLARAQLARLATQQAAERIDELSARAEKATSLITGMPMYAASDVSCLWDSLSDLRTKYERLYIEELDVIADCEQLIADVPSGLYRLVLKWRYLQNLSWTAIAARFGKTDRQVQRWHGAALTQANAVLRLRDESGAEVS